MIHLETVKEPFDQMVFGEMSRHRHDEDEDNGTWRYLKSGWIETLGGGGSKSSQVKGFQPEFGWTRKLKWNGGILQTQVLVEDWKSDYGRVSEILMVVLLLTVLYEWT